MRVLFKKYNYATVFLILGLAFVFIPFIILGLFNHPCVDDFNYSIDTVKMGFWQAQIHWYTGWGGRYFSSALLSLDPLVIRSFFLYKLVPLVLFLGLFHSLYLLIGELTDQYFGKLKNALAVLVLLALYIDKMPSVSQGFYWFTGAMTYQSSGILMLYLCTCIIRLLKTKHIRQKISYSALSFILIFAVIGSNEIIMVILFTLLLSITAWKLFTERKVNWILFVLVIAASVAVFFAITAPGNAVRLAQDFPKKQNLFYALKSSLEEPFKSVFHWGIVLPVLGLTIFGVPWAAKLAEKRIKNKNNIFIHPAYTTVVYIGLLTAAFLPGFWSMGWLPPGRGLDIIYLLFILGWFINVYFLVEFGLRKYGWALAPLPEYLTVILCVFIFLNFFKEDSNVRVAYADLILGKAINYDRELKNRYKIFAATKEGTCKVEPLNKPPNTIFFDDITSDAKDWRNRSYAEYFHKDSIVITKPGELSTSIIKNHLKTLAEAKGRYIGTAIDATYFLDRKYFNILPLEFNLVTPEYVLKFDSTEPQRNDFNFKEGDIIVDFAKSHHMKIRGHTLVWYAALPSWLTGAKYSKDELEEIMRNHIKAVVEHYKGKVYSWDVVNEAFESDGSYRHNIWYDTIGPQYIEMAFKWAHEFDPNALLFYNDYDCETMNRKSDAIYQLIKELKSKGVPIDGMGFQSHFDINSNLKDMDLNIKRFATLDLETDFTELDVSIVQNPGMSKREKLDKQADIYRNVVNDCLDNPSCKMIVLWGFTDAHTWKRKLDKDDAPAIFDKQYNPKPAYYKIIKALRDHE